MIKILSLCDLIKCPYWNVIALCHFLLLKAFWVFQIHNLKMCHYHDWINLFNLPPNWGFFLHNNTLNLEINKPSAQQDLGAAAGFGLFLLNFREIVITFAENSAMSSSCLISHFQFCFHSWYWVKLMTMKSLIKGLLPLTAGFMGHEVKVMCRRKEDVNILFILIYNFNSS